MKNILTLLLILCILSCKKNGSGNVYGTYQGQVHELGSWSFYGLNGEHNTGNIDTLYAGTIQVIDLNTDSVKFIFGSTTETFYKNTENAYCLACDRTRNLSRYRLVVTEDSLYYDFRMYGGNSVSYSSKSITFSGKK